MRRRDKPNGLPARLYDRHGKRTYSIGYKAPDSTWELRLKCMVSYIEQINAATPLNFTGIAKAYPV
jgi:hypothetical protein